MTKPKIKSGTLVVEADDLYTITEYAKKLGVTAPTVRYRMLIGQLVGIKINGLTLIVGEK